MSAVKLYIYDLSNGLARSMSLQLTGRQIDGIWHTSIVVYGMEVFYGQGIMITAPGKSHHGTPLQVVDMGETAIDKDTFQEYINQMRDHYTADKYHLLDFNCNSFTNDCAGFLTGGGIPSFVKDLPTDFLSTPFGAALRPTIDAMYTRSGSRLPTSNGQPIAANSLLQSVAAQATTGSPALKPPESRDITSITAPLLIATNPASLKSIVSRHKAAAIFFTSATCAPCKIVEPVFEDLAYKKASAGVAFVKVDLDVGLGNAIASEYGVRATPTFIFLNEGRKSAEVKGADVSELRSNVDLTIFQAFPPHRHTTIKFPVLRAISLQPILYKQIPSLDVARTKMLAMIDGSSTKFDKEGTKSTISRIIIPALKTQFEKPNTSFSLSSLDKWISATEELTSALNVTELFPLVDFWRLALLDPTLSRSLASKNTNPLSCLLQKASNAIAATPPSPNPRNYFITLLRMLSNGFVTLELSRRILGPTFRPAISNVMISCLLDSDTAVRSAAAGLAFNVAAHRQALLVEFHRNGKRGDPPPDAEDSDWEIEISTAILEALSNEVQSEEVVHRLTAALALFLHLSSSYDDQLHPLMDVLQAKTILRAKLEAGHLGGKSVVKEDVRRIIEEVADKLC